MKGNKRESLGTQWNYAQWNNDGTTTQKDSEPKIRGDWGDDYLGTAAEFDFLQKKI